MEQLQQQVAALEQQNAQQQEQLRQMMAELQRNAAAPAQAQQMILEALRARDAGPRSTLVDNKGIGKPPNFKGPPEGSFRKWSKKFVNFVAAGFRDSRRIMEWAAESEARITPDLLRVTFGDLEVAEHFPEWEALNEQVYICLEQFCEDEADDIVNNTAPGQGLEAYRKLNLRFDPATAGRKRNIVAAITSPQKAKIEDLSGAIVRWEEQVRHYENRRNPAGDLNKLDDELKVGIIQSMCHDTLNQHLTMNAARLATYVAVRQEISSYIEARIGLRLPTREGDRDRGGPAPMDVGSLHKGHSKGKGKGKKGKSGKGGGDGRAPANSQFQGECRNCGKWGHRASECWRESGKGGKAAKGKGKDKGAKGAGAKGGQANTLETTPEQPSAPTGTPPELGTLSLCPLWHDEKTKTSWWEDEPQYTQCQYQQMTLDSGASVTAFPARVAHGYRVLKDSRTGTKYKTASGDHVPDEGQCEVYVVNSSGKNYTMRHRVVNVHKPLVSASASVRAGNIILLSSNRSFIAPCHGVLAKKVEKAVESVIENYGYDEIGTPVYEQNGVYVFDTWVVPKTSGKPEMELSPVIEEASLNPPAGSGGSRSHGPEPSFPRPAQWP